MKKLILTSILALLVAAGTTVMAQDYPDEYLGLPGDNLNLYAVMKLFQESETLEGFERSLNDENSRINNLDLNGDNLIDYITVNDYVDGNVHTIVLRAMLGRNESQDVAVFTVQRFNDGSVQIQLVGDEALYGRNYIIEPNYDETPNPGYTGRRSNVTVVRTTYVEIAAWPLVRFIYMPNYMLWHSSWYWGYYPVYWHPWRPWYWHYYYGYHYHWYPHYYASYHHADHYRYSRYNDFYYRGIRAHSPVVSSRIREGNYRATYSHPEQRRDGEALYTKLNAGRDSRTSAGTSASSQGRRSVSQPVREGTASGTRTDASRRSANPAVSRSTNNPASGQNSTAARRSTTPAGDKPAVRSSSDRNTEATRRATTPASDKPAVRSSSDRNTEATRRATTPSNNNSGVRSSSGQNNEVARRPVTSSGNRPAVKPSSGQNTEVARRSSPAPARPSASSSSARSSDVSRRSAPTVSGRSTSRPQPAQSSQSARTSRPSSGSSASRSKETRSGSSSKGREKSGKSESSNNSRRK